jgi:hypothetical protein
MLMNKLIIGLADKTEYLYAKQGFLLIDDGPICDAFLKRYKRPKEFDPRKHSFNSLWNMTVRKARDLTATFYGPEGKDTLTVRNGRRALTQMLAKAEYPNSTTSISLKSTRALRFWLKTRIL